MRNPTNTVAYFRDFLGKDFKSIDPSPCHASAHPIDSDGTVAFQVQEKDAEESEEKSTITVPEITSRHLRRLKQSASDFLGKDVTAAVITIPSDFSEAQKSALTQSAEKAGIEVLQFIPEPVSSLLAYEAKMQLDQPELQQEDEFLVVADLGGTRSDVAVVASRGGMYTTLATAHDYELGGQKLDEVLIEYAAKEFLKKNKNASDPRKNERSLAKLKLEAEAVKKSLSQSASATFSIESLADGIDFSLSINRTRYELLANKVFASFTRLIQSAVQKADLDSLDIGTIVLAGGTSHTPKIASNMTTAFPDPPTSVISPSTSIGAPYPSEMAARGAAIQASLINEFDREDVEQSTHPMVTVAPHLSKAIGFVDAKDEFHVLIEPETAVPVRRSVRIDVKAGGDVLIKLCEGTSSVKVSQAEKTQTNGKKDDDDDEDEDDSDDEPEEIRSKVWAAGAPLAEAAIKGVKKGGKVEVQVNVDAELKVTVVCKEVGKQGGVRGVVEKGAVAENGSA